jgi:hypothetical protein
MPSTRLDQKAFERDYTWAVFFLLAKKSLT